MTPLLELTDETWDSRVLASPVPVLVDVWAPWCLPCKRVDPIVRQLAEELGGRLVVAKLNADEAPRVASRYEILSLPTLLLFDGGEPVARITGVPKPDNLRALVMDHLTEE